MSQTRRAPVRSVVRPPPGGARPANLLLAALPVDTFRGLSPFLTTIPLPPKHVLHHSGERLRHVYFLNSGVASITTRLSDGRMVEAATVGDEGMLGVEAFLGDRAVAYGKTLMQVAGTNAAAMRVDDFRRELARRGPLHELMGRYTQVLIAQMMQSAACNAIHDVRQRCARWLLMTHDRMHEQDFRLSHEFLAIMLGVHRPTVSVIAAALQHAGLIRYAYGHVTVVDRGGLEAASCECYPLIRAQFNRLRRRPRRQR
jgi:CRP-like cAMP-binding protein